MITASRMSAYILACSKSIYSQPAYRQTCSHVVSQYDYRISHAGIHISMQQVNIHSTCKSTNMQSCSKSCRHTYQHVVSQYNISSRMSTYLLVCIKSIRFYHINCRYVACMMSNIGVNQSTYLCQIIQRCCGNVHVSVIILHLQHIFVLY